VQRTREESKGSAGCGVAARQGVQPRMLAARNENYGAVSVVRSGGRKGNTLLNSTRRYVYKGVLRMSSKMQGRVGEGWHVVSTQAAVGVS